MREDPSDLGKIVRAQRQARGLSQAELASRTGTNQQTIARIENGKIKKSSFLPVIVDELGMNPKLLVPAERYQRGRTRQEGMVLSAPNDFPIHGAAAGGRGAIIVTTEPVEYVSRPQPLLNVRDGYGIIVVEDSMFPEFSPGDIALIHPHLPPAIGSTCVFYSQQADGTVEALIKRLRRITADSWHVIQWNPAKGSRREFSLKRSEWQTCHVTVGRFNRR